jgi:subtilisin family serine protease
VTWAVVDTGIDGTHPHFERHKNVDPASSYHQDFTGVPGAGPKTALTDPRGHGTHVAGIIAGEQVRRPHANEEGPATPDEYMRAVYQELSENQTAGFKEVTLDVIRGMSPETNLVSLKVLDEFGDGDASNVITALSHIQVINGHGRELHIHGVNISLGYPFEAKWFACGHTPLCVEINRLVKSGVVVVIAAGNTGYGTLQTSSGASETGLDLTINDPGNAEHAITVGSTHRDEPHKYGVSYFSSKGPTGDGRLKPDLLAPGEKIISCAVPGSNLSKKEGNASKCRYMETSGTSMAAPHVSGAIAAFLSIRKEFIGEAERVKQIFLSTATDLGRDRYFQGAGLLDLMRAIQSI